MNKQLNNNNSEVGHGYNDPDLQRGGRMASAWTFEARNSRPLTNQIKSKSGLAIARLLPP
jgi:hypothetical protein